MAEGVLKRIGRRIGRGCYLVLLAIVRLVSPRYALRGTENLPDGACLLVGNHSQMYGPIAAELYVPGPHWAWCAGEMMAWREVPAYAYEDFWSKKPLSVRWFFRIASYLITPVAVCVFNNAHTIPVYHDARARATFRRTLEKLHGGGRVVIFPECYTPYNNVVYDFRKEFVDIGRMYARREGKPLPFVPFYVCPRLGTLSFGKPVFPDTSADPTVDRARVCRALQDAVTELALSQPPHTVVPYPNMPKKEYPGSHPLKYHDLP